jgi:hypothetical protein
MGCAPIRGAHRIASIRAMANELLDFVMSLVRDPDAAARYHADPDRTIADAHLGGVTSADVNNLLPMVSESLTSTAPISGVSSHAGHIDGSVWTSGAATAAFDAFTPHVPAGHDAFAPPTVVDPGASSTGLPTGHEVSAPFSDVAAVPTELGSDSYHVPDVAPDANHPVDGGLLAWEHGDADSADWPGSHHNVHPGFDHFA